MFEGLFGRKAQDVAASENTARTPDTITVQYLNNDGGGFAERIVVQNGITVAEFLEARLPEGARAADRLIRVNRQVTIGDHVLQDNDRITVTPVKIEGA